MIEKTANLEVAQAYDKLRSVLLQRGGKIAAEKPPERVWATQGSMWGMTPRTAKKTITYRFASTGSGTRINASSVLSSDWKNITIVGSALSVVVAAVCLWISVDLQSFLATLQPSWWSWIATTNGAVNAAVASSFITLTRILAILLVTVVVLEAVIYVYAKRGIDVFSEETLKQMV